MPTKSPPAEQTWTRIRELSESIYSEQVQWRRHFHRNPEPSFEEYETTAYLTDVVRHLGLEVMDIGLDTGLVAELRGRSGGSIVAIRSDIDALLVQEETDLAFRSARDGCMHACGHDLHMATVLGAAAVLASMKETLCGTVRFLFQPGEEMPPGGALRMIERGALHDVGMIFGLHVDPTLRSGRISLRDGVVMGSVTDVDIVIHGRGGHAARPQDAVDAIATAAEVVQSVQKIASREIDPLDSVVITFGRIEGGAARNAIADRVTLVGTVRAMSDKTARGTVSRLKRIVAGVCRAHQATFRMEVIEGYPPMCNHSEANEILRRNHRGLFGTRRIELTPQVLGAEDFARYLTMVPGAMFRLGVRNKTIGADKPWHSPRFMADEEAMTVGTALLAASAIDFLTCASR